MMTSSNGNIFSVVVPLCRKFTGHRWIPLTKPVTRSFDVSLDLRLNQSLRKQLRRRWFETPSRSLWRHCNAPETTFSFSVGSDVTYCPFSVWLWWGNCRNADTGTCWQYALMTCCITSTQEVPRRSTVVAPARCKDLLVISWIGIK